MSSASSRQTPIGAPPSGPRWGTSVIQTP